MATLQELYDQSNLSELRARVTAAGWNKAKDVFVEDPGTANHAERMALVVRLLADNGDGQGVTRLFRGVLVLLQDKGNLATDSEIQDVTSQVFDKLAEVGT